MTITDQPEVDCVDQLRPEQLVRAWRFLHDYCASQLNADSYWTGQLSSSSLSTATALSALLLMQRSDSVPLDMQDQVSRCMGDGARWLATTQNRDGGFGDTDQSHSNVATTLLVVAALQLMGVDAASQNQFDAASAYVSRVGKWDALRRRYGRDKTFVAPIIANCALAGLAAWEDVPDLPFEAAWLPQACYRLARLPVVSYAIPALVAIGQSKFHHRPTRNPVLRAIRSRAIEPTLRVLTRMQPSSGGYLEAVPLTSFVLMNLAAIGRGKLSVSQSCLRFLLNSQLEDGSWPIDTNLAAWITSSTINALARRPNYLSQSSTSATPLVTDHTIRWLLHCQYKVRHPFTGADPGGWGWTNLSGAVPDADDTPAALLALANWQAVNRGRDSTIDAEIDQAAARGLRWLVDLQNSDGGWPTFCRGWGKLPFDRSGTDLTAHALRAIEIWRNSADNLRCTFRGVPSKKLLEHATRRGLAFLIRTQQSDGSWIPLWFGNQDSADEENRVYGTSRVLLAYSALRLVQTPEARRGLEYLVKVQNECGGWGGGPSVPYSVVNSDCQLRSSIEETGVALEALILCNTLGEHRQPIARGQKWLVDAIEKGHFRHAWPIGFYFAKLWYHERMYPVVFSLGALGCSLVEDKTSAMFLPTAALPTEK